MKMKIFLAALFFTTLISCSKDSVVSPDNAITVIPAASVPAAVVNTFSRSFNNATEVEWHKSGSSFESEFNYNSQHHLAQFEDNGTQKSHSVSCLSAPVPANVLAAFRATHPSDVVYEWKLNNDGSWKAHFMRGAVKWEATYSIAGVLLKEEHY
jgi:hypothetical protein